MRTLDTSFYAPPEQIHKDTLRLTDGEAKHARSVLRCEVGDVLTVVDGCGCQYEASVQGIFQDRIDCKILNSQRNPREPDIKITLAQALCRSGKFDLVVEKCTELGVHAIVPTTTERSYPVPRKDRFQNRLSRWQKIAVAAMKQSGRSLLPRIESVISFETLLTWTRNFDASLIAWEGEKANGLRSVLSQLPEIGRTLILVGPEGGFPVEEVEQAKVSGFQPFSLGPRRLRTETASIVCVSLVLHELGDLNPR